MNIATDEPIAIVSDGHANLEALEAVLEDIKRKGIKIILNLGDLVGYGPNPKECLDKAISEFNLNILGNCDVGLLSFGYAQDKFVQRAVQSLNWSWKEIEASDNPMKYIQFLRGLESRNILIYRNREIQLSHGTPNDPLSGYVPTVDSLVAELSEMKPGDKFYCESEVEMQNMIDTFFVMHQDEIFKNVRGICFVGHNHRAGVIKIGDRHRTPEEIDNVYELDNNKVIITVGSVGQARDINGMASYVVLDNHKVYFYRIRYDVDKTISKIQNNGIYRDPELLEYAIGILGCSKSK